MKILGISGSLRTSSTNTTLLKSILHAQVLDQTATPPTTTVSLYEALGHLPHYNAELDDPVSAIESTDSIAPTAVRHWRTSLATADGVIICTPEYAFGIPGVLKNALDWTASSGEFVGKPVLAISASPGYTGGDKAHASLLLTLKALSAQVIPSGSISIPAIRQKLDNQGNLTDSHLTATLSTGLSDLYCAMAAHA